MLCDLSIPGDPGLILRLKTWTVPLSLETASHWAVEEMPNYKSLLYLHPSSPTSKHLITSKKIIRDVQSSHKVKEDESSVVIDLSHSSKQGINDARTTASKQVVSDAQPSANKLVISDAQPTQKVRDDESPVINSDEFEGSDGSYDSKRSNGSYESDYSDGSNESSSSVTDSSEPSSALYVAPLVSNDDRRFTLVPRKKKKKEITITLHLILSLLHREGLWVNGDPNRVLVTMQMLFGLVF
ncbi:hypothetical protein DKX38_003225 [Salix brachista]|uniref:Uncharacterized protein n=1 Tax=Salix brachista TaxID=2182728 RepID=A0A5N5NSM7_9ROSI|nr:hypothetical protein DKX38_003219 [Salix brachista]KAB5569432.1 hypothetical protein DKX38_003225 [Salix brachista]